MKYLDISRTIASGMEKYPSDPPVEIRRFKSLTHGDSCNLYKLVLGSHAGTHIDAPHHIFNKGKGVDEIKIQNLICDVYVTEIKKFLRRGFIKKIDMKIVKGILFKEDKTGLTVNDARILLKNGIKVIGTGRMSIEESSDKSHPVHRLLLSKGIAIIEGLDLSRVRPGYYKLICLPLKIKNGDGAPVRAVLTYD